MNKSNSKKFILIIVGLLVILLLLFILLLEAMELNNKPSEVSSSIDDKSTIQGVIRSNGSEYIKQEKEDIYVLFSVDLYNEDGSSNEAYFEKMISELTPFFSNKDFTLIDEKKDFKIYVKYDYSIKEYRIYYNDIEDFYSKTDGDSYSAVDSVEIVKFQKIYFHDNIIDLLKTQDTYFSSIRSIVGEGTAAKNNYTDYFDGKLSIRLAPNDVVKNIIFKDGYRNNEMAYEITLDTPLNEIYKSFPNIAFGSIKEGFLGYRTDMFYTFFYEDEISMYPYSYKKNVDFEKFLLEYIETRDLNTFVEQVTSRLRNYDYYRYDEERQEAYILFASKGIEINIKGNDLKGITLYNNYCFTNKTKSLVKNGYITLNSEKDLIAVIEEKRRNDTLNFD